MCLEARGITAAYSKLQVLWGVDVSVATGSTVLLLGANGAGKSTFLRAIAGLLPVMGGEINYFSRPITTQSATERARTGIAYMSETGVFTELSVDDNLRLGARIGGASRSSRRKVKERLEEMYEMFPEIAGRRKDKAGSLSGGQRKLVGVAKALAGSPRLVIMDEPSSGLSPKYVSELVGVLGGLTKRKELTLLLAEQNVEFLSIADRAFVIEGGKTAFAGTPAELSDNQSLRDAFFGITSHG